ncbi:GntR family transcriptional regulator [Paraburkholderia sp. DGU8]|uniref:GntR family transcriptional regulator n=1 Tax=Paraburkholderia sp. DGU8 TaxID=3161997 RepID=UPI003464F6E9
MKETDMDNINDQTTVPALRLPQQNGVPKYLLLRNYLSDEIASGRLESGAKLPPEDALADMMELSLGTVQRSLRMLVDEGKLVRKHGTGTFVADGSTMMHAPFQHCRFIDEATGQLLPIFSKVVRRRAVKERGLWSTRLLAARPMCVERLFSIANEFTIYTHLYFDADVFPELATLDTEKLNGANFKDLLAREFHHPLTKFSEQLAVRVFPAYVCKALRLKAGTSGAVLEIFAYDRRGEVVYFQDLYIPPNSRPLQIS